MGNERARFGPFMFTVEHIRSLQLIFKKQLILGNSFVEKLSSTEVSSELFPKFFASNHAHKFETKTLEKVSLVVTNTEGFPWESVFIASTEGDFLVSDRLYKWRGDGLFHLKRSETCNYDWAICEMRSNQETVLWKSPYSRNAINPPKSHWVPTNPKTVPLKTTPVFSDFEYS